MLLVLVGLSLAAQALAPAHVTFGDGSVNPSEYFHRFLPPHSTAPGQDPFSLVEGVLTKILRNRATLSLYAAPAFIWFSTRLYASARTALNEIFDVSARPEPARSVVVAYLLGKLRDTALVLATVLLFLANTVLTGGLAYLQSRGTAVAPQFRFFVSTLGRVLGEGLAFAFQLSLFYITYRYASRRRPRWRTALLAATFAAVAFEIAKRLYALYLAHFASLTGPSGDANIGAIVLFVLWVYYTAVVFLLGGVVAEIWDLRKLQQRQRAILA